MTIRRLRRSSFGFTLLEIMLVVMIIALLLAAAMMNMGGALGFAGDARVKSDLRTISVALMMYKSANGFFPSTEQGLKALAVKPDSEPRPTSWRNFLTDVPKDPWHKDYIYEQPGKKNPNSYDLFTAGENGKVGDSDDVWHTSS